MKRIALATLALALAACGSSGGTAAPSFASSAEIKTYLEGKTLVMTGADIPSHPNGFNEDVNYGAYSQCYADTTITIGSDTWHVVSHTGTISGTPAACDHVSAATAAFDSTAVAISNVQGNGECFDITVTYTGFSQAGRGAFKDNGATLELELFFGGQAVNANCANGLPGASGVLLGGVAFTGDAVQTYRIH